MTHQGITRTAGVALVMLALAACSEVAGTEQAAEGERPAAVEPVKGSAGVSRITLTDLAAERLDVATVDVVASSARRTQTVIPYGAVIYDSDGGTWAYTEVEPLVYLRERIAVASISGQLVELKAGPAVGTPVVSVGAAELYGAELGVDH